MNVCRSLGWFESQRYKKYYKSFTYCPHYLLKVFRLLMCNIFTCWPSARENNDGSLSTCLEELWCCTLEACSFSRKSFELFSIFASCLLPSGLAGFSGTYFRAPFWHLWPLSFCRGKIESGFRCLKNWPGCEFYFCWIAHQKNVHSVSLIWETKPIYVDYWISVSCSKFYYQA